MQYWYSKASLRLSMIKRSRVIWKIWPHSTQFWLGIFLLVKFSGHPVFEQVTERISLNSASSQTRFFSCSLFMWGPYRWGWSWRAKSEKCWWLIFPLRTSSRKKFTTFSPNCSLTSRSNCPMQEGQGSHDHWAQIRVNEAFRHCTDYSSEIERLRYYHFR